MTASANPGKETSREGIFLTFSQPKSAEDDAAYNRWYDEHHAREALLMPGFVKARRFKLAGQQLTPAFATEPGFSYVTIYEVDDVDLVPEMQRIFARLPMVTTHLVSGLVEPGSVKAFMYEQISEIVDPTPIPEGVDLYGTDETGTDEGR
ncbi:MAG: hypothetical protein JWN62_832 [Acidimicrobiales bacterium]|nr:hypothetical protein [Acidimicrobiales bacterium]